MPEACAGVPKGGLALAQLRGDLCEIFHGWANILLVRHALPTTEDLDGRHTSSYSRGGRSNLEAVAIKVQACEA